MGEITPEALRDQVEDMVRLLTFAPTDQVVWAERRRVPAEELALQLYDLVGVAMPRLRDTGMVDGVGEEKLVNLVRYLEEVQTQLFVGVGVTDSPEWAEVRRRAGSIIRHLEDTR